MDKLKCPTCGYNQVDTEILLRQAKEIGKLEGEIAVRKNFVVLPKETYEALMTTSKELADKVINNRK